MLAKLVNIAKLHKLPIILLAPRGPLRTCAGFSMGLPLYSIGLHLKSPGAKTIPDKAETIFMLSEGNIDCHES